MGRGALISKFVFTYIILVILTARERNFDEFKSGGLHEKHAVATWNLGTISALHRYTVWAEYIAIESVLHRKHITSPLQSPTG
jgi:hypothetical protein